MKQFLTLILAILLVSRTNSSYQHSAVINNDLKTLTRDYLPEQFTKSNFTLKDAKTLLHKKCQTNALRSKKATQSYENIDMAANKLLKCANDIGNITHLMAAIEIALPAGDLDTVFHKLCNKVPQAKQCLLEFNTQILTCLSPAERIQNGLLMQVIISLLSFICHKNGDQIALFVAEEGPKCLEANKKNISKCMNATLSAYVAEGGGPPNELPDFVMGPKQCIDLHNFEECVLSYLEKCNEITPANIIESLFQHVKKATKCQKEIDKLISFQPMQVKQRNMAVNCTLWITFYLATFLLGLSVFLKNYFGVFS